ncbi:hypothetical protein GCK32_006032 [Trichostrongylus colubriformis]|uniref:Uncharacterized protein n=1 Tax=Trichostrongylus colubriformis TaxID=6319 RepID=A0AAN8FRE0_TRICO
MPTSEDLEVRLKHDLSWKIAIVDSSQARPSEQLIQHRLRYYGTQCHDASSMILQARYEYASLMRDKLNLFTKRGAVSLSCETQTKFFVLAHEWYEILVTVNEVDELSRVEFIRTLSEEEHTEPSEPGDRNYPNPTIVRRSWMRQMKHACFDLHDDIRRQNEEIEDCIQRMKGFSDAIMKQCTKNAEGSKYIIYELRKVSERSKEATAQITRYAEKWGRLTAQIEEQTKELQDWKKQRKEDSRSSSPRTGCKRKHGGFDIPPSELQRYERIRDRRERELTEIDDFPSRNVVKDRRFEGNMKDGEE